MWSDNETETDLLDFSHLVEAVTTIIANDRLLPSTIGVYGDWGSGKSSLLRMIQKKMESDEDVLCLSFNGWLFEGYENAKTALMGAILDEIGKKRGEVVKVTGVFKKLVKSVDVLKMSGWAAKHGIAYAAAGHWGLTATAGIDAWSWLKGLAEKGKDIKAEDLKEFVKEAPKDDEDLRRTIIEFRDDFKELLGETKLRRLVVMIDDLDRCNPDTIIETLEAIKLFLFVPNTVFILGADERLIKYAVRRRFPEFPGGERAEVGRDYLEKLIQFPVRVPPLGRPEMETYIALLFAEISTLTAEQREQARIKSVRRTASQINEVTFNLKVAEELFGADKLPDDLAEGLRLGAQLAKVLTVGLNGNPRQGKRFLNTLLMRISMAKSRGVELKRRILAKLMLLEYFKPEFFKVLATAQVQENGRPKLIG